MKIVYSKYKLEITEKKSNAKEENKNVDNVVRYRKYTLKVNQIKRKLVEIKVFVHNLGTRDVVCWRGVLWGKSIEDSYFKTFWLKY